MQKSKKGASMQKPVSFKELRIGQKGEITKKITEQDVEQFAALSLDNNPIHMDESFAAKTQFKQRIVHGMLVSSLISAVVGTKMPGPGSAWMDQSLRFLQPVHIGDTIKAVSELLAKIEDRQHVIVRTTCYNQKGEIVVEGVGLHKILTP